jgi:trans-aconitate 2-methyltransferase
VPRRNTRGHALTRRVRTSPYAPCRDDGTGRRRFAPSAALARSRPGRTSLTKRVGLHRGSTSSVQWSISGEPAMTEWNASEYNRRSALQKWLADKSLTGLDLRGSERVLDVGCGDGKITAEIAERLPSGSVVGVDPSTGMIAFAREHFVADHANLSFEIGDATRLSYRDAFDLVVSFNALHWVPDQAAALRCIRDAMRPTGRSLLQLVSKGSRKPLEDVIEETCADPRWSRYFADHHRPYLHLSPEEHRRLAERCGLRVDHVDVALEAWDFGSRGAFGDFAAVTFVEWARWIPPVEHLEFIADILDRYQRLGDGSAADAAVFHFYQMRIALRRA